MTTKAGTQLALTSSLATNFPFDKVHAISARTLCPFSEKFSRVKKVQNQSFGTTPLGVLRGGLRLILKVG